MKFKRIIVIVLDSVGIGALPDANHYGDTGADTIGSIARTVPGFTLPNMERLGLGKIAALPGTTAKVTAGGSGRMREVSAGKDTMTGHWELMGLETTVPFLTYPDGFPEAFLQAFSARTGRGILCNQPASGTAVIEQYGAAQMQSGDWIIYTSADSVLQIAAHEAVIPLETLYEGCRIAREMTLAPPVVVGRVIARPYTGEPGQFVRTTNRHDYALEPGGPTVLDALIEAGHTVSAIGKINDIFSGRGVSRTQPTKSNEAGIAATRSEILAGEYELLFTNLVDFDSLYGHRRDPYGYAEALRHFDQRLPDIMDAMTADDLLILTADHGNDPTHPGTDHTREYVPLLVYSPRLGKEIDLGDRGTFADVAATIADNFKLNYRCGGISFLHELQ